MVETMLTIKTSAKGVEVSPPLIFYPRISSWVTLILIAIFYLGICQKVFAHDPGLSRSELRLVDDRLLVHSIYARRDIESLVRYDFNRDGAISAEEVSKTNSELASLVRQFVDISWDNSAVEAADIVMELDASDAVHIRMVFPVETATFLKVRSPIISSFSLGHRQFVKLIKGDGSQISRILSARSTATQFELPRVNAWVQFNDYLQEGIWHIWIGFDHILFLIALLLPAAVIRTRKCWQVTENMKTAVYGVIKIVTAFTIAHSITLALSVFELISLPSWLIETVIAVSVMIAALNNIFAWWQDKLWSIAFIFGLIHGMGFASVLAQLGLPYSAKLLSLFAFNVGVEAGQLAIVAAVLPLIFGLRNLRIYHRVVIHGGSYLIALVAIFWLVERIENVGWDALV